MNSAAIRQELHHIIDIADDAKVEAMYNIMRGNNLSSEKYTAAELKEFYSRLEKYDKGEMPGFSVEEAHSSIKDAAHGYNNVLNRSKNDLEQGNGLIHFTMDELETYSNRISI